ncbi:Fatty acid synthase, partial [Gonioctena quinquepunctata]
SGDNHEVEGPEYIMTKNTVPDHANGLECGRQLSNPPLSEEVVISGIGGVFPKAKNIEELEQCLFEKLDLTTEHYRPNFDHPDLPKRSATINEGLEDFDCGFFGLDEHQSSISSPEMRMLLEKSIEAIIDAGLNPKDIHNTKTNLYIAQCTNDSEAIMKTLFEMFPLVSYERPVFLLA